jgi:nucleoside 2-deoxyribosyltransferase
MTTIYLSHHYFPSERQRASWIRKQLEQLGFTVIDPFEKGEPYTSAWFKAVNTGTDAEVEVAARNLVHKDLANIKRSDILVVLLPHETSNLGCYGTIMEIVYGYNMIKSVYVVTQALHPWLLYHATKLFGTDVTLIKFMKETWT